MTSTNDPLVNITQTQGMNFFSVRADDRISNPKKNFSGESISQSAQSSKFEIYRACVYLVCIIDLKMFVI